MCLQSAGDDAARHGLADGTAELALRAENECASVKHRQFAVKA